MFSVYIQAGEFEIPEANEVLRLFREQEFREGDYFTIGRDNVEYLEIFYLDGAFALSHIRADADEGQPLAEGVDFPTIERIVDAFCGGGWHWQSLLRDAIGANTPPVADESPTPARGAPDPAAPAIVIGAEPIHPEGVGFTAILWILLLVGLLVGTASYFLFIKK